MLIGGEWRQATSSKELEVVNPATEEVVAAVPSGDAADVQLAADTDQRSAILAESLAQTALLQTDDHHEGLAAARERREPVFRGR